MTAPLVSLTEDYGVVADLPAWPAVYASDTVAHIPHEVQAAGKYVRHVLLYKPGMVEFWWQASDDNEHWIYVCRSD